MAIYSFRCRSLLRGPLIAVYCLTVRAQVDLLSVREAESLVEQVPEVIAAKQEQRCPDLSTSFLSTATLMIQVRGGCPDANASSTLISNYMVNRRTGIVTEGDDPKLITTTEMDRLRTVLLKRAHERGISAAEAGSLATVDSKSRARSHDQEESFSVTQVGRAQRGEMLFAVEHHLPGRHMVASAWFTVNAV